MPLFVFFSLFLPHVSPTHPSIWGYKSLKKIFSFSSPFFFPLSSSLLHSPPPSSLQRQKQMKTKYLKHYIKATYTKKLIKTTDTKQQIQCNRLKQRNKLTKQQIQPAPPTAGPPGPHGEKANSQPDGPIQNRTGQFTSQPGEHKGQFTTKQGQFTTRSSKAFGPLGKRRACRAAPAAPQQRFREPNSACGRQSSACGR